MQKRNRGVALMTVLSVAFLLVILTGALVGNHQSNFQVLGGSIHQRQSLLAAYSGLDFAKMMLERDETWCIDSGARKFGSTVTTQWGGDLTVTQLGGKNKLTGVFDAPNPKGFEIEVDNYLNGGGEAAGVRPSHAVRLKIMGYSATFQTRIEVTMTEAPLYDSAASSNKAMDMGAVTSWQIGSRDKLRNWIRSNEDINIPNLRLDDGGDATKSMRFLTSSDGDPKFCDNPGVAWTKRDIYLGAGTSRQVDDLKVGPLLEKTNGMMARKSNLNYNIYDLKVTDLQAPPGDPEPVKPGTYTLIDVPIKYQDVVVDEDNPGDILGPWGPPKTHVAKALKYTPPGGGPPEINMLRTPEFPVPKIYDDWKVGGWGDDRVVRRIVDPLPAGSRLQDEDTYKITPNGEMTYHFSSRQFTVTNAKRLVVDGPLKIDADANNLPPSVKFIKDPTPPDGTTATDNPSFIQSLSKGNIEFQGTVNGKGAVASDGNLTLGANSDVSTDENAGVVLWSNGNVTFNAASSDSNMFFRGLVYAKGDVELKVNDADPGAANKIQNLNIEGALVAQSGSIKMVADTVKMIYDPSYLDKLTRGLPSQKCRLAQVSFRIY